MLGSAVFFSLMFACLVLAHRSTKVALCGAVGDLREYYNKWTTEVWQNAAGKISGQHHGLLNAKCVKPQPPFHTRTC